MKGGRCRGTHSFIVSVFLVDFFFFFFLFPRRKQHPRATGADVVDGSLVNKECEVPKVKEEVVQVF